MTITIDQLVQREVGHCVSALVATLAGGYGLSPCRTNEHRAASDLCEQALDLTGPIPDYEEAAREAGWQLSDDAERWVNTSKGVSSKSSAKDVCESYDIEPYDREVYEHWLVSDWLADELEAKGEKVDKDFAGLTVWARTATGQGIAMDSVIEAIHAELIA